jgi:hypothetical protein
MSAVETKGWSVHTFAAFWADPDPSLVPRALTEDIVGYWTGREEPIRGREDYTRCIAQLVDALPDVRIEVAESARNDECTFIRWIMHATGRHGPFEFSGIDRVRMRGPLVAENRIVCDTAQFEALAGMPLPWCD